MFLQLTNLSEEELYDKIHELLKKKHQMSNSFNTIHNQNAIQTVDLWVAQIYEELEKRRTEEDLKNIKLDPIDTSWNSLPPAIKKDKKYGNI